MKISVVIPSFNRAQTLARALQSVLDQSSAVDEIIVVDDGSTDASHAMLTQDFPQARIIRQQQKGVSAARNRGIAAATQEWIALLDSDDYWLPQKIAALRAAHAQAPDYVLYHSDEIWIRNGKRVNPMRKHRKSGGWIFEHCLPLCAISPSATLLRKSVVETLGCFDETLPACEDYDLWLRLCHRYPVYFLEQALIVKYGGHDDQLSRQYPVMDQFRIRALDRLLREQELSPRHFAAAREMLLHKLDILLKGAYKHGNQSFIDEFGNLRETWQDCGTVLEPC